MKEIVKEHPLRPIILRFDLDKPLLDFEKKGLEAHYLMHDLTWDMLQQFKTHHNALEEIDIEISELEYLLLPIEQELDFLEVFLRIKDPSALPFDEKDGEAEITIDIGDFFQGVVYHNQRLQDIHASVDGEHQWFKSHFDMIYEKESWIAPRLWDDIHQIYRNYLQAQVDIVTLDRDQEEFRGALAEVFDYQDSYMDYGDSVFAAYNELHNRSEQVYRRAEVANSRLADLKQ
ncbi:hypothetical protein [Sphingobacterium yanglingense]|uniref:Uncharacterized protein n=1 Tax=Sphingobacterium yanglingense TaxID=1437280 RepID=A0A4V3DDH8_9SPHI|nr:hypothetical protein [Sphingobacterium yanglingense]TDQ76614.1 hypothetical protein CLV99_3207 [Sphingobacterium yanglingense]